MKLNSGHKIILTVSLLSALTLIIVGLVIYPTIRNITDITNDTYKIRVYMEKRYNESLRSRLTKKKIEEIKKESSDLKKYLFYKTDALELIQYLETLSKKITVDQKINSNNLDQIKPGGKLQINLTVSGKYIDVLKYINTIENEKYFFNIESIRMIPHYTSSGVVGDGATAYISLGLYVSQ